MQDFIERIQAALPETQISAWVWDPDDLLCRIAPDADAAVTSWTTYDTVLVEVDCGTEWQSPLADKALAIRAGGNLWLHGLGVAVLDAVQAVQKSGEWRTIVAEQHGSDVCLCAAGFRDGQALTAISVVVPTVQATYMPNFLATHRSLQAGGVEYIVVSNGTAASDYQKLISLRPDVLLHFHAPLGFPAACNTGVAVTRPASEVLVLANDDTEMTTNGWDTRLWQIVDGERDLGAISPVLSSIGNRWQLHNAIPVPDLYEVPVLFYAWIAFPHNTWDRVGGLDPAFGMGNGEDIDHSLRIRENGLQLIVDPVTAVYHRTHGTFDLMTREQFNGALVQAATKLKDKWGERLDELAPEVAAWAERITNG